jgi:hypothetical protein
MRMRRGGSWEALWTEASHRGQRALPSSCLRWLCAATVSLAIVLSAGCLSALDGVMASSRQSAGGAVSPGRLTLSQEEGRWTAVCT